MKPASEPYQVWEWTTSESMGSRTMDILAAKVPRALLNLGSPFSHMRLQPW
ncbi:MAG: hypothetical protein RI897_768 [Verrucomicrobiota bacterium]